MDFLARGREPDERMYWVEYFLGYQTHSQALEKLFGYLSRDRVRLTSISRFFFKLVFSSSSTPVPSLSIFAVFELTAELGLKGNPQFEERATECARRRALALRGSPAWT